LKLSGTILDAIASPALFAPWFKKPATWRAWRVFLKALFGLPMDDAERETFTRCTGRAAPSVKGYNEAFLIVGRRGGKSLTLATIAVFLAAFRDWRPYVVPGEMATILIVATDKRQSRTIKRYAQAMLTLVAALKPLVERADDTAIELKNGVAIEISTASFRSVRGYTVIAGLVDEAAYLRDEESATPDVELLNALRPAMATIPEALLLVASSPYAKKGILYQAFRESFGKDDPVTLVWRADTMTMNPALPKRVIDREFERDPVAAMSEYGRDGVIEFRSDIESFLAPEVVDAAVVLGRGELPPMAGRTYVGFADAAGGSGGDSFAGAVCHVDDATGRLVLDAVRERKPPFSPEETVAELAAFFKSYAIHKIRADHWGGEFPREAFRNHGVECEVSERVKSDLYKEFLPLINSGRVELLDHKHLTVQLCNLERRTARGGKDSIDHAAGAHDDIANAVCGAIVNAASQVAPSLVRVESFYVNKQPVAMPTHIDVLFATAAVAANGTTAVAFWARCVHVGVPLTLLDIDVAPLTSALFASTLGRLIELKRAHRTERCTGLYSIRALADQAEAHNLPAHAVDAYLADPMALALTCASYVNDDKVKLAAPAHAKAPRLPLNAALSFQADAKDDDPLRVAVQLGIALTFGAEPSRPA
jgi:hypothetical protein